MPTSMSTSREDHKPTVQYVRALRKKLAATYPSTQFCFSAGGHDRPDLELRTPLADRRADRRLQRSGQPRVRQRAAAETARRGGRGGSAHSAIGRLSAVQRRCRPHQGAAGRTDRAERGRQHAGVAVGQLPDSALASGSIPKTGTQYNVATQTPQYRLETLNDLGNTPLERRRRAPDRSCCRTSPTFIAASAPRWSATTMPPR